MTRLADLRVRGMQGHQQERVKEPRPVRLAKVPAQGVTQRGQGGHQPARQLTCFQVERRGDDPDGLPGLQSVETAPIIGTVKKEGAWESLPARSEEKVLVSVPRLTGHPSMSSLA